MIEAEYPQKTSVSPCHSTLADFLHSEHKKIEAEGRQTASGGRRSKLRAFLLSEPNLVSPFNYGDSNNEEDNYLHRQSNASASFSTSHYGYQMDGTPTLSRNSADASPYMLSPWNQSSPYNKSPWILPSPLDPYDLPAWSQNGLIGSLVREEGHVYSLAVSGDLLYTGSDSKNIRVWKKLKEYSGFKSKSGLIKAIVVFGDKLFTGHEDGKIRIWKFSPSSQRTHKRIGSLPTFKDYVKCFMKPKNYVEVRRHKNAVKIKHFDAISCLSLEEEQGLLYSGSWDKTVKVWRISDSKCLESIHAHDDAVNSVVVGFRCLVFSGSADGTVKAWRREFDLKGKTKHVLEQVLLKQENAITALAVNRSSTVLYCGSSDGLLNFWEGDGRSNLHHSGVLRGHKQAVLCLAAAGNLVFSGSADKNICVWKRDEITGSHSFLSVLTGHTGPVKCLAVEEDPTREEYDAEEEQRNQIMDGKGGDQRWIVYSGSLDKTVKVWRVLECVPDLNRMSMKGIEPGIELACDGPAKSLLPNGDGRFSFYSPCRGMVRNKRH